MCCLYVACMHCVCVSLKFKICTHLFCTVFCMRLMLCWVLCMICVCGCMLGYMICVWFLYDCVYAVCKFLYAVYCLFVGVRIVVCKMSG